MATRAIKVGVVGCGSISDTYLQNMIDHAANLEVVACCAAHFEHAQRKAAQYGISACSFEEMLANDAIEMVVVLTPVPTHYELIRRALEAGKHVYTEKVMTTEAAQAAELVRLADEKGLYLGAAPDTFLGASLQTARRAIDEGLIGDVTGFVASANRDLDYYTAKYGFLLLPGGGICYDYGVYYLTALVSLLGPVQRVCGVFGNRKPVRLNRIEGSENYGKEYAYPNESYVHAVLEMESGSSGCFSLNGDSVRSDQALFVIHGTKGMLKLGNPDEFGGAVRFIPNEAPFAERVLESDLPFTGDSRGIGPAEMADAILSRRPNRASKEMAYHVLDALEQIARSAQQGAFMEVHSRFDRPAAFVRADSEAWRR